MQPTVQPPTVVTIFREDNAFDEPVESKDDINEGRCGYDDSHGLIPCPDQSPCCGASVNAGTKIARTTPRLLCAVGKPTEPRAGVAFVVRNTVTAESRTNTVAWAARAESATKTTTVIT
jgi:hypothetical protein